VHSTVMPTHTIPAEIHTFASLAQCSARKLAVGLRSQASASRRKSGRRRRDLIHHEIFPQIWLLGGPWGCTS
jgi:hypothetical protein